MAVCGSSAYDSICIRVGPPIWLPLPSAPFFVWCVVA